MTLKSRKTSRGLRKSAYCQLGLLLVLAFAFPHQLFGQCSKTNSLNCAYVTDGSGGDIFAVDPTGAVTKIQSIKGKVTLNDIRVATDNKLYVTSNGSVLRLAEDGSGVTHVFDVTKTIPGPFTGIRFSPLGDAYVNTPGGVFRIGPDSTTGKHLVQIAGPTFPAPVQITDTACNSAGGLAVWPTGDLLIACNNSPVFEVLRCPAIDGVASGCTGPKSAIQHLFTNPIPSPIVGLAVDAVANILVASSNTVTQFDCTASPCTSTPNPLATFGTDFPAFIDTAPFPPGCNSAAVTVFVSTGDGSGKNGKVWAVNTVDANCSPVPPPTQPLALISSTKPAVGMGVASASRTLTKLFPNPISGLPSESFNYGPFSIQITNTSVNSGCNLSLTAQREAAAPLDFILAKTSPPSRAIPFNGEQSWRTTFHGGFLASNCTFDPLVDSHIGITGSLQFVNPWIALIDDTTGTATLDPIPSIYPGFSLEGVPGDPIKITNAGLFTSNARIVLVDRNFTANVGKGYTFCGFLPKFVDPTNDPSVNSINAGSAATFKFFLTAGTCSDSPIDNTLAAAVLTGFSAARLLCEVSAGVPCQDNKAFLTDPTGQSVKTPPHFKYDPTAQQFIFTLDTNQPNNVDWCNGVYVATANSDSFAAHSLTWEITGAPAGCQ